MRWPPIPLNFIFLGASVSNWWSICLQEKAQMMMIYSGKWGYDAGYEVTFIGFMLLNGQNAWSGVPSICELRMFHWYEVVEFFSRL